MLVLLRIDGTPLESILKFAEGLSWLGLGSSLFLNVFRVHIVMHPDHLL